MGDQRRSLGATISSTGLIAGPLLAVAVYALLPDAVRDGSGEVVSGLSHPARATAALATLMATWWLTEAIHITATAILPLALLPMLGVMDIKPAAAPYAHPILFLFFGGFILGLAMEKWGLHKRIALLTLRVVGGNPSRVILGFMITCAVMSMWVSNTATTLLMIPIASSVVALISAGNSDERATGNLAKCLLLGIAYASSIGGTVTLVGTAPNIFLAGHLHDHFDIELSMTHWIAATLPGSALFIVLAWLVLTRWTHRTARTTTTDITQGVRDKLRALGPVSRGEWTVFIVFCTTAILWITRPLIQKLGGALVESDRAVLLGSVLEDLQDATIAMLAALALFVIPVRSSQRDFAMDWRTAERGVPWGILILLGGGFSLANAITSTGLDAAIARSLTVFHGVPDLALVFAVVATIVALTELTSNTATTTALIPILGAAAPAMGIDPIRLLVPATIAASYAFMLPVATPPNAIAFSTGKLEIRDMARTGLPLNIIGVFIAVASGYAVEWVLRLSAS
ncbi:MAG: di- and tricarboxylate transporter [Phycisphaeraceae bacterium]|nr:MAG: di- and tricarboxylate transporter [Phycisphaeraceae bacterium]